MRVTDEMKIEIGKDQNETDWICAMRMTPWYSANTIVVSAIAICRFDANVIMIFTYPEIEFKIIKYALRSNLAQFKIDPREVQIQCTCGMSGC